MPEGFPPRLLTVPPVQASLLVVLVVLCKALCLVPCAMCHVFPLSLAPFPSLILSPPPLPSPLPDPSDMSAFKAANPGAVFADFIRWHSPNDWIQLEDDDGSWPPAGKLSDRMAEEEELYERGGGGEGEGTGGWRELWEEAEAESVDDQRPLFHADLEGEKVRGGEGVSVARRGERVQCLWLLLCVGGWMWSFMLA